VILIDETSRQRIEEVVNDLINTGDFELVFRYCSDEEMAAREQAANYLSTAKNLRQT